MATALERADLDKRMRVQQTESPRPLHSRSRPTTCTRVMQRRGHRSRLASPASSAPAHRACRATSAGAVEPAVRFARTEACRIERCARATRRRPQRPSAARSTRIEMTRPRASARATAAPTSACARARGDARVRSARRRRRSPPCSRRARLRSFARARIRPPPRARERIEHGQRVARRWRSPALWSPADRADTTAPSRRASPARRHSDRPAWPRARAPVRTDRGCASAASGSNRSRPRRPGARSRTPAWHQAISSSAMREASTTARTHGVREIERDVAIADRIERIARGRGKAQRGRRARAIERQAWSRRARRYRAARLPRAASRRRRKRARGAHERLAPRREHERKQHRLRGLAMRAAGNASSFGVELVPRARRDRRIAIACALRAPQRRAIAHVEQQRRRDLIVAAASGVQPFAGVAGKSRARAHRWRRARLRRRRARAHAQTLPVSISAATRRRAPAQSALASRRAR